MHRTLTRDVRKLNPCVCDVVEKDRHGVETVERDDNGLITTGQESPETVDSHRDCQCATDGVDKGVWSGPLPGLGKRWAGPTSRCSCFTRVSEWTTRHSALGYRRRDGIRSSWSPIHSVGSLVGEGGILKRDG